MTTRERVIEIARTWLGTPFHDNGQINGVGVDCARLLAEVYAEAGLIDHQRIAPYSPQWMLHRSEPLFEDYVRRFGREVESAGPGDIVLYRVGRSFAHGAIVTGPGVVIHAFKTYGFVVEGGADDAELRGRARKYFTMW